jgi:TolB protein
LAAWRLVAMAAFALGALCLAGGAQARSNPRNGRLIAFSSSVGGKTGVYVMHADGSHVKSLTPHLDFARDADFSPNGSTIAFNGEPLPSGDQVLTMGTDGSHVRDLTPNEGENDAPSYAPNGKRITYRRKDSVGVMRANGKGKHAITKGAFDGDPDWSPRGNLIAFDRETSGSTDEIAVVHPDGSHVHKVTSGTAEDEDPAFSPTGRLIAFTRFVSDTSSKILVIHPSGKHLHTLIPNAEHPSYSPDGRFILFDRSDGHDFELFRAHADGSHIHRLTHNDVDDFAPVWQPKQ